MDNLPLVSSCGFLSLPGRGLFRIRGAERAAFLHGLVTNDIKKLTPNTGCHCAWLTPKGKMLADLCVLAFEDHILLDCVPSLIPRMKELLATYGPFHSVQITDDSSSEAVLHVGGPGSHDVLKRAGLPVPDPLPFSHTRLATAGTPGVAVTAFRGALEGVDLRVPVDSSGPLETGLRAAGAERGSPKTLESCRIQAGIPVWGAELDESVLPNEAGLEKTAISYTKGCYIGQETVARIRTYGHVNRRLASLRLPPLPAVSAGDQIVRDGVPIGTVTSAARSVTGEGQTALGFVKREFFVSGTKALVTTPDGEAEGMILALPLEN